MTSRYVERTRRAVSARRICHLRRHGEPKVAPADRLEQIDGAVPVLNIRLMRETEDQEAAGIGEDIALAAFVPLATVIATNTADLRGFLPTRC